MRVPAVIASLALVLAGCGGRAAHPSNVPSQPQRVTFLSLSPDSGFPGPSSVTLLRLQRGKRFTEIARLVPLPPPAPLRGPNQGETICLPVVLTIGLSGGSWLAYGACQRPRSLRPVLAALCPLLHLPGFCARYRNELRRR
jgi:hypothetical protein